MALRAQSRLIPLVLLPVAAAAAGAAASAATAGAKPVPRPALSETLQTRVVDWVLTLFRAEPGTNSLGRFAAAGVLLVAAVLLRRAITHIIFAWLRRFGGRTATSLDGRLLPALQTPAAWLVFVFLAFAGLKVLVLPPVLEAWIDHAFDVTWVAVLFWGLLRALNAVIDHLGERDSQRGLGLSHFVPLIKKTLAVVFIAMAALVVAQRLGVEVGPFIAGLGIGGLAFALAAQETLANFFGSLVVVLDRPFRVGEFVRIAGNEGTVEDIGLRSTRLRTAARTLIVIPNKTVAAEAITNFSRMPQRRVDQVVGLTYGTSPEQMEAILGDIRGILEADPEVQRESIAVHFAEYAESSLNLQIIYYAVDPDWARHMRLRERINLRIMRAVAARGLSFAFPTQTLHVEDDVAQKLTGTKPAVLGS